MDIKERSINNRTDPIPGEYGHPIPRELMLRELGFNGPYSRHSAGKKIVSHTLATKVCHTLCTKEKIEKRKFKLPTGARTTFHLAFSADGTKVASCHGDHSVYVCNVNTGDIISVLTGHPRTPWCVVFHPTQNDLLASGCLSGHVRVWDLKGGCETLITDSGTVIASLAFHPTVRLLAIATFNEIIFWDWNLSHPLARTSTQNTKEKVRLVRFDRLGTSLITGITNYPNPPYPTPPLQPGLNERPLFRPNILSRSSYPIIRHSPSSQGPSHPIPNQVPNELRVLDPDVVQEIEQIEDGEESPVLQDLGIALEVMAEETEHRGPSQRPPTAINVSQDRFQESYHQLVTHYRDLVDNYQAFLRNRIPRLLESRALRDSTTSTTSDTSVPPLIVLDGSPSNMMDPEGLLIPEERPGPSSRVLSSLPPPLPPRASQVEATTNTESLMQVPPEVQSILDALPSPPQDPNGSSPSGQSDSNVEIRSIEALAQNIIEMQNLCSQARRDAPMTIETQHIIELQNIRRHLEVLQEQTRDLQSSIRATLTSLARGSLDAIRSHISGPPSTVTQSISLSRSPTPPTSAPPTQNSNNANSTNILRNIATGHLPSATIDPLTRETYRLARQQPLPPDPEVEVIFVSNDRESALSRQGRDIPSLIAMNYETVEDPGQPSRNNYTPPEPIPGPSRDLTGRNPFLDLGSRRYTAQRESAFYESVAEHSRNCPFSREVPPRPPTRMRTLTELGEVARLERWPTQETGLVTFTRSFRSLRALEASSAVSRSTPIGDATPTPPQNNPTATQNGSRGGVPPFWSSGPSIWVSNDLGVSVFLALRLCGDFSSPGGALDQGEGWQRIFSSGLALIPPVVRVGQRQAVKRKRTVCFHPGSNRFFSLRPSPFEEFRNSANFLFSQSTNANGTSSSSSTASSTSSSPTPGTSSGSSGPVPSTSPRREIPAGLDGGFTRIFYMRLSDEYIPVYSHQGGEGGEPLSESREGIQPNVYLFPIGLFLRGNNWELGTQTIGIYWPSGSREEEESIADLRRNESLVPIYNEPGSRGGYSPRTRIEFDTSELRVILPNGVTLTMIQPGLSILDAVTTAAHLPRPRAMEGTVYVDYIAPFLERLERLFGHRHRRNAAATSSYFANGSGASGSIRLSSALNPNRVYSVRNLGPEEPTPPGPPNGTNANNDDEPYAIRRMQRRSELINAINESMSRTRRIELENLQGAESADLNPILFRRRQSSSSAPEEIAADELPDNIFVRSARDRLRQGGQEVFYRAASEEGPPTPESQGSSTRRVIRLAVDTATAEVLRRQGGSSTPSFSRAIESRIERVLNERGNRGMSSPTPTSEASPSSPTTSTPPRMDDLQYRITNAYLAWSRARSNGGPVERHFNYEPASGRLIPQASTSTDTARLGRRPGGGGGVDGEEGSQPPPRVPRIGPIYSEWPSSREQRQRHDSAVQIRERELLYSASRRVNSPYGDRWIIRRQRAPPAPGNDGESSLPRVSFSSLVEGSSARTRMAPVGVQSSGGATTSEGRGRRSSPGPIPPPGMSTHAQAQAQYLLDESIAAGRYYPGYIPEILITPRARPPTYYTMDAATTAFLSSRIQKWDFSSFFIPDITKRDDYIVVRECSLHSDACLDISNDSDFLAVLQPSDNGSYSSVGIYSLRDETLGSLLNSYHFDQNTVSISISPSCDYIVVGYAGRGPIYRAVQSSRIIGQILSLTRDGENCVKLVPVKELLADSQNSLMSINCMHWVPIPGYGIIYGTNTGELVLMC